MAATPSCNIKIMLTLCYLEPKDHLLFLTRGRLVIFIIKANRKLWALLL